MEMNFWAILAAALSTLVVGFIWYHPKVFGTVWMHEVGVSEEKMKNSNMFIIFGMAIFYGLLISMIINVLVVHQYGALGMIGGTEFINSAKSSYAAFMSDYGTAFRTYQHGALHGFMAGLFLAFPLIATNSLFERKSWKYVLITGFFWIINFTIMGAIICGWVK